MFFIHKFNYKKFFPKTLFGRFLVIIIAPTILAQLIATYMFYQRHWSNVSGYMANNLVNEVMLIRDLYNNYQQDKLLLEKVSKNLNLKVNFSLEELQKTFIDEDDEIQDLYEKLYTKIQSPININYNDKKTEIYIEIPLSEGKLLIIAPRKKIDTPTTYIFILWMTGTATILSIFAILFLRNQVRSISKLASAAEEFGKGQSFNFFKPSGAYEVKKAGFAFLKMKERIERQILQRTHMLAAVSHDLRTPLTRMKLELEMLGKNSQIQDIKSDIIEMEKMIEHYLDFTRGEGEEKSELINLSDLIKSITNSYKHTNFQINFEGNNNSLLSIRTNSFKRALYNIIDNSLKYASSSITIILKQTENFIRIEILDDGPGINEEEKQFVFKPFYRTEAARSNTKGGVGLGLAIAKDVINSHGGDIILSDNLPHGLKVVITIPI